MGKKAGPPPFIPRPPVCLQQFADEGFDNKKVEDEAKSIQNRLREILTQVWDENATFQRIMYKNQNQHRRTVYFRRLLQVRRDLLLLQSFGLKDVVETLSHCVSSSKQKALPPKAVLGSLGRGLQSKEQLVTTVQRRLLGAARLVQLMADPILNAGMVIEGLLSQSFFMPFALTVLALLARFRVLLTQALYDVIAAFNLVSAFVQKVEIPSHVPLYLECSWDGVKLAFSEKAPPRKPPPPPPQELLLPLPASLSDAGKLPDAGWFIDDRVKEKLPSTGVIVEPVLYEREVSFILEDAQFGLLGEEDDDVPGMEAELSSDMAGVPVEAGSPPREADVSVGNQKLAHGLSSDVRAELESWKAELESWGSKEDELPEEEPSTLGDNTKKRVAYVAVQVGGAKKSKVLKTGHPM